MCFETVTRLSRQAPCVYVYVLQGTNISLLCLRKTTKRSEIYRPRLSSPILDVALRISFCIAHALDSC